MTRPQDASKEETHGLGAWTISGRSLAETVRHELAKFSTELDGLTGIWAWLAASTRGGNEVSPRWTSVMGDSPPPSFEPRLATGWTLEEAAPGVGWRLSGPVDAELPRLGQVVALFSSRSAAEGSLDAIRRLANSLRRGVQHLREETARRALADSPPSPASFEEARAELLQIAQGVQRVLDADGAKIYVLRRAPEGPMVWRLCNTKTPAGIVAPLPLLADHGMADWVLREGRWLLLPEFRTPVKEVKQRGVSEDGAVEVIARPASEMEPDAPPDPETSVFLVPFTGKASVAGVLSVWREGPAAPPFDQNLDRESLEQFAPHIAAACQRLLQLQKAEEQLAEMSTLARMLADSRHQREGYDAVAAGTAKLADAACALLLHHDFDEQDGHRLYPTGIWITAPGAVGEYLFRAMPALSCGADVSEWQARVELAVRGVFSPLTYRGLLNPPTESAVKVPSLTVALFDAPRSAIETEFPSDRMLGHFARAFLQSAAVLLDRHVPDLTSHLADELGRPPERSGSQTGSALDSQRDPKTILEQAAFLLLQATGADAALAYMGTPNHMTLCVSSPPCPKLLGLPLGLHSLARESLLQCKARFVLEAGTKRDHLDTSQLGIIAEAFQWGDVRSWLCCPVFHHGRILGLVKLLTNSQGAFLGSKALALAENLAPHVAWEMYQANRRRVLESLADLSREIAGFSGRRLGEEMASRLRSWAQDVFHRPDCTVVVLAQVSSGAPLVRAAAWPDKQPALSENELAHVVMGQGEDFEPIHVAPASVRRPDC